MLNLFGGSSFKRGTRKWDRAAAAAETMDFGALRALRNRAREMRKTLNRVLYVADERLALPAIGANAIERPLNCDWAYRPELWRGPLFPPGRASVESHSEFGSEVKVFHDCQISELTFRQVRNLRESDLAPYGFRMDVFRFDGSFLSLVIELPDSATKGLERRHVLRLTTQLEVERPLEIFARLNIKSGPNIEQIVRELPIGECGEMIVEFDLAYSKINEKRVERVWLDLIFEGAEMNQMILRDVSMTRRPRAEI